MSEKYLIVFLRFPESGKVKMRLAQKLGNRLATEFYKICAENIFSICDKLSYNSVKTILFSSEKKNVEKILNWTKEQFQVEFQIGGSLGLRMQKAFQDVFNDNLGKAIIIGTDILDISEEIILKAFDSLDEYDIVLGPAKDGGYYLLGMNKKHNELFESIPWSSSETMKATINNIEKLKLKYKLLDTLGDIDTKEDLIDWLKHNELDNSSDSFIYEKISNLLQQKDF